MFTWDLEPDSKTIEPWIRGSNRGSLHIGTCLSNLLAFYQADKGVVYTYASSGTFEHSTFLEWGALFGGASSHEDNDSATWIRMLVRNSLTVETRVAFWCRTFVLSSLPMVNILFYKGVSKMCNKDTLESCKLISWFWHQIYDHVSQTLYWRAELRCQLITAWL